MYCALSQGRLIPAGRNSTGSSVGTLSRCARLTHSEGNRSDSARTSMLVRNDSKFLRAHARTTECCKLDLFGTRPVDTNLPAGRVLNQPRLRFAYFHLAKKNLKITAGQDKA